MGLSFAQVYRSDPAAWVEQAASWDQLSTALDRHGRSLVSAYQPLLGGWQGKDADAACAHMTTLRNALLHSSDQFRAAAAVLGSHANVMVGVKSQLNNAVLTAQANGFAVQPNGALSMPGARGNVRLAPAKAQVWQRLATGIARAVDAASASDERTRAALAALAPPPGVAADPATIAAASAIPVPGTDPARVAGWWNGLDQHTREGLLFAHPELIGGLDGVPAQFRDRANRATLAGVRAGLQNQVRAIDDVTPRERAAAQGRLDALNARLTGVNAIETRLAGAPGHPPAFLLGLDTEGNGHAVVAVGDPDHADNVLTYVPGTFSNLSEVGGEISRADAMGTSARTADPSAQTSTIAWVGYDAPQSLVPGAAESSYAQHAEMPLIQFQNGLRATHVGPPSHNTVLGHSYGTTVVGFAARDHGLNADDVIFVGSPGVGVQHAADLHLNPSHVWASRAQYDPIQVAVNPEQLAKSVPGPGGWIAQAEWPGRQYRFGMDPSDSHFGGQGFRSGPGNPLHPMATHSEYWDDRSESLRNIGRIAVGRTDVTR